jgi:hypothetical protein
MYNNESPKSEDNDEERKKLLEQYQTALEDSKKMTEGNGELQTRLADYFRDQKVSNNNHTLIK